MADDAGERKKKGKMTMEEHEDDKRTVLVPPTRRPLFHPRSRLDVRDDVGSHDLLGHDFD
jgi:hypothetical protein